MNKETTFLGTLFKRNPQTKGCLHGKTAQQKKDFFDSLISFAETDPVFFAEQHQDLLPHEKSEFMQYVIERNKNLNTIKQLTDIIEKLAPS